MDIEKIQILLDILKEVTLPVGAFSVLAVVIINIYKILNTDGPVSQMIFKPKNPKWDTKILLKEGDKLHQLIDDAKRQEVFKKLSGIITDASNIDSIIALENSSTKINYSTIRNAMSYLRFNNSSVTVEITKKDKVFDTITMLIFILPILGYFLIAIVLFIEYALGSSQNLELGLSGFLVLFMATITAIFSGFLRRPYISAKRLKKIYR
ncbi:hypothetical protein [Sphingobacterium kitahiroshimense]|uniref:hypothetical protein n=1 Tax=Sphingobacterium kitahiroshimense TaxID=470446 RepID=UPI003209E719